MRKRSKKKRNVHSVRDSNGRFCKAVSIAPEARQVAEAKAVGIKGVAEGKGGEAAIKCLNLVTQFNYWHPKLKYPVVVKKI